MNMNFFTNAMGSVSGIIIAIMGFAPGILGCSLDALTSKYDCTGSWLPPQYWAIVAAILGLGAIFLKFFGQSGVKALYKPTVAVDETGKPGTVTQEQVDAPAVVKKNFN